MKQCSHCHWQSPDNNNQCPNCGRDFVQALAPASATAGAQALITGYFKDLWQILFTPTEFFGRLKFGDGITRPLVFALVTHWLGAGFHFFWSSLSSKILGTSMLSSIWLSSLQRNLKDMDIDSPGKAAQLAELKQRIMEWFMGVGSVLADPFMTLLSVLVTAFFVYLGAKILVSPRHKKNEAGLASVTYESAVKVVAYGMTPAILTVIPLMGGTISAIWTVVTSTIAAAIIYRISWMRGLVIALFPKLLFIGTIFLGALTLLLLVFKFFFALT